MQYFGLNIVEGVAENWVEVDGTGWRWVHGLAIPENKSVFFILGYNCFLLIY